MGILGNIPLFAPVIAMILPLSWTVLTGAASDDDDADVVRIYTKEPALCSMFSDYDVSKLLAATTDYRRWCRLVAIE
jgi:hypothetical protein